MGEVYVGFDEALARKVAMKAIREDRRPSAEARARSCARPGYSRSSTTLGSAGSSTTSRGTRWTSSSWSWSRDDPSGWRCPPGSSPPGRNARDGVAAKALDYFASIGDQELADGDRFRRSLHEAHVLARDLVARQPGNGEWLMGLGAIVLDRQRPLAAGRPGRGRAALRGLPGRRPAPGADRRRQSRMATRAVPRAQQPGLGPGGARERRRRDRALPAHGRRQTRAGARRPDARAAGPRRQPVVARRGPVRRRRPGGGPT